MSTGAQAPSLTVGQLQKWFTQFNESYFRSSLPMPQLCLSRSRTRMGSFSYRRERRLLGRTALTAFTIRVSVYYEQTERQWQETLLHEMIHYYIAFHRLRDRSAHGPLFRDMMEQLNREHGWHLTVSARTRDLRPAAAAGAGQGALAAERPRLVLLIERTDGRRFVSVVNPRYALRLDRQLGVLKEVKAHSWFTSSDGRFAAYPEVRSLRGKRLTVAALDALLPVLRPVSGLAGLSLAPSPGH